MDKEARCVSRAIALALAVIAAHDLELARLLNKSTRPAVPIVFAGVTGESAPEITPPEEDAISAVFNVDYSDGVEGS
jgi:hypothetical protein